MEKLKRYFGSYRLSWAKVIMLAVISAVVVAVLNELPFLEDTSFQDPAITFEFWILLAVFITVNCQRWQEAALKCFVFFLVSQPLIYLIEVPFEPLGWQIFGYYGYWFKLTLLTLPGAVVAFQLKRKSWLSVAVLSVATGYLAYMTVYYFRALSFNFPHHLLSCVFCLTLAVFLILVLLDDSRQRSAALILVLVLLIVFCVMLAPTRAQEVYLEAGEWTYSVGDSSVVAVDIGEDNVATVKASGSGSTLITFTNADGSELIYSVTVTASGIFLDVLD